MRQTEGYEIIIAVDMSETERCYELQGVRIETKNGLVSLFGEECYWEIIGTKYKGMDSGFVDSGHSLDEDEIYIGQTGEYLVKIEKM